MKNERELIELAEQMLDDVATPAATKATLLRTILEMRGLIGPKATRGMADEESSGDERTAEDIKRDIRRIKAEMAD